MLTMNQTFQLAKSQQVAAAFFVSKKFQKRRKKKEKRAATFCQKQRAPCSKHALDKDCYFFHEKSRNWLRDKYSVFSAKLTETSSQVGLKTLFIFQVAAAYKNMEISRRLQLQLKKKKKEQFPPSSIVSSPSWAGLGLTVWEQPVS